MLLTKNFRIFLSFPYMKNLSLICKEVHILLPAVFWRCETCSLALRGKHILMFKEEAPGRTFVHVEEKVMNGGENYIMRSVFSSSSKGVLNEQDLCNSKGAYKIILKWMLKNQGVCELALTQGNVEWRLLRANWWNVRFIECKEFQERYFSLWNWLISCLHLFHWNTYRCLMKNVLHFMQEIKILSFTVLRSWAHRKRH